MDLPQFKSSKHIFIFKRKPGLNEVSKVNYQSRVVLYVAKFSLLVGIFLIVLDNAGYLTAGSHFGAYDWATMTVLSIGIFISLLFIPYLYFSSFKKFKENDEFWDEEIFWILPLFFFGTFFQYGSGIFSSEKILLFSIAITFLIHFKFVLEAQALAKKSNELGGKQQYFRSLAYLSAYYLLFLGFFFLLDPVTKMRTLF